jgi:Ran GTPase-activating protein (RanGAP) involved in mRNA processing and transport
MALSQNANLTVLKLGYNNLGDSGVTTLAAGIAVHKALVLLDLGFNNFGDEGAIALATAMQQASDRFHGGTLQTLYLAGNMIGEDGAFAMADSIRQGSQLSKLYMTGNRIGADGVKAITEAILEDEIRRDGEATVGPEEENPAANQVETSRISSFCGMEELFLGGTGMGTLGCHAVARLLEKTSYLRVMSFPNCDIGDEEVGILASSIKANKARLPVECIQLSFNNMTHKGLESLTNAVWGSNTLKELRLDNNNIGDRGAHQVAAILPALKALEVLDVGFNSIKATGLNVLMKAVAESHQLNSLSVSGNAVDVPAAKAVAYALAYNHSLRSVFLVHCNINHEGQRHISAGIVSNSHIALRKLTGFHIGRKCFLLSFCFRRACF